MCVCVHVHEHLSKPHRWSHLHTLLCCSFVSCAGDRATISSSPCVRTHTHRLNISCTLTTLVRAHKCHPAPFSLSLSLRCGGKVNEFSVQMKPSSITALLHWGRIHTHTHTQGAIILERAEKKEEGRDGRRFHYISEKPPSLCFFSSGGVLKMDPCCC